LFPPSLYQRFEKRKNHSPEKIKISFKFRHSALQNGGKNRAEKYPSPPKAGWGKSQFVSNKSENKEFVFSNTVPRVETRQTFTIILPNLIHKSKRRDLKKK